MPVRKEKRKKGEKKGLRVSNFSLLWVVFKLHYGSKWVNADRSQFKPGES